MGRPYPRQPRALGLWELERSVQRTVGHSWKLNDWCLGHQRHNAVHAIAWNSQGCLHVQWPSTLHADNAVREDDAMSAPPIQHCFMIMLKCAIVGCTKTFLNELMEGELPKILFFKMRIAVLPCLRHLQKRLKLWSKSLACTILKQSSRRINHCQWHSMSFDFNRERFCGHMKAETWTNVGKMAGGFASASLALHAFLKIPTPVNVRQHLGGFGQSCSPAPPRDPKEKECWKNGCFCLRVNEVDFSSDQGQTTEGQMFKSLLTQGSTMLEEKRLTSIQCGRTGRRCRPVVQQMQWLQVGMLLFQRLPSEFLLSQKHCQNACKFHCFYNS